MYSALDPAFMFEGPLMFLTVIIFSSGSIVTVVSSCPEVALRLVHIVSLFASVALA